MRGPFATRKLTTLVGLYGLFSCGPTRPVREPPPVKPEHGAATDPAANLTMAPVRGYRLFNQLLSERFTAGGSGVDLRLYLDGPDLSGVPAGKAASLTDLLGVDADDGIHTGMKNAEPNTAAMLLWYVALDGFSAAVSDACSGEANPQKTSLPPLRPDLLAVLKQLCAWPLPDAIAKPAMRELWDTVMQVDAPEAEFVAWETFALEPGVIGTGQTAVHTMILTMLDNPFLLLAP